MTFGAAVSAVPWYHSIELPGGIVTPGEYDHRSSVQRLPIPATLAGKRCLDVGTHDGFWAFEMERRGASEVLAIDIDDPAQIDFPGAPRPLSEDTLRFLSERRKAFGIARDCLGSKVERRNISVYQLTATRWGRLTSRSWAPCCTISATRSGLYRPSVGSSRVSSSSTAVFSISKTVQHPRQPVMELLAWTDQPFWEVPNIAGLRRQFRAGGWNVDRITRPFFQGYGQGWVDPPIDWQPRNWPSIPRHALLKFGALHVGVLASPA